MPRFPELQRLPILPIRKWGAWSVSGISSFYPDGFNNADYTKIVNDSHYNRLNDLLEEAVEKGAQASGMNNKNGKERIFEPVILTQVSEDAKINNEEIFGPILVVVS